MRQQLRNRLLSRLICYVRPFSPIAFWFEHRYGTVLANYFDIFSPCIFNQSVIKLCGYIQCRYYLYVIKVSCNRVVCMFRGNGHFLFHETSNTFPNFILSMSHRTITIELRSWQECLAGMMYMCDICRGYIYIVWRAH